jgi:hypothetical protein
LTLRDQNAERKEVVERRKRALGDPITKRETKASGKRNLKIKQKKRGCVENAEKCKCRETIWQISGECRETNAKGKQTVARMQNVGIVHCRENLGQRERKLGEVKVKEECEK